MTAFKGATASGTFESDLEPLVEGGLSASIPLLGAGHVRKLWEAAGLNRNDPKGAWFRIDEYEAFNLELTGYKLKTGLFAPVRWFTNAGFLFLRDRESALLMGDVFFLQKLGSAVTHTIAEVCPLVDRVMMLEWPFVDQNLALSSVDIRV